MSFPKLGQGGSQGAAWGRFIPQETDIVRVSFDYDNSPYIVGYDVIANKDRVGWSELHDQYERSKDSNDPERSKFSKFTPLNPGEYDFMSSGGAYIYGNDRGRLYLEGGSVSMSLIKNDLRLAARAKLTQYTSDDCEFRFGQVRRAQPDGSESPSGDGSPKEFNVALKKSIPGGSPTAISDLKIGSCYDDAGTEITNSKSGSATRFLYRSYSDAGAQSLQLQIDKIGNVEMLAPDASTFEIDFGSGTLHAKVTDMAVDASGKVNVNCDTITLGNNAEHPLFLTKTYRSAEETYVGDLDGVISNIHSMIGQLQTQITAMASVFATGTAGPVPVVFAGLAALAPVLVAQNTAPSVATNSVSAAKAKTTFLGPYDTYLSQHVKNS
jgi:hypothetical protein